MGRVIAVSNLKGGIGKTTTVVNVGAGLALKGARVLLVDTDAQGNLAMALGVRPRRTIYEVLVDGAAATDCITAARPNLDLLAADHALLGATPEITRRADWSRALERGLRPLVGRYDFILVDSGGSLTPMNVNALMCASDVIAPTTVEPFSIKGLELLFTQITQVKGSARSIRMIIPTMYDPRSRQSGDLLAELHSRYGALVAPPVRVNVRLSEAPAAGRTIYEYDPRSRGAVDYALLVEHISTVFGFQRAHDGRRTAGDQGAPTRPTDATSAAAPPAVRPAPAAAAPAPLPDHCPNCGRPLKLATLAGYRVAYCDHCRYKAQTLAGGPRR
ncbi:MAG TPA: AAA family ATPase [Roseiflexaceae bacterium]|nr:AAA family ATPase [Roseiflexaceae bacterium]